ncbi:hypothetical protein [Castellaniella sp.]|uniref:hypothetical protein n=1 Tax=Castellaniella sp. TaxID=1955812 RepID=UPI002AFF1083|nr:hypothetical protein [Castellaniella sp.]
MKIQNSTTAYMPQRTNPTQGVHAEGAFKNVLNRAETAQTNSHAAQTKPADLTNMTPMQMREWLNDQIRTGKMTLDESTPFVGMTIGAEVNNSPVNYLLKIQGGIEAAAWRGDPKEKAMWAMALDIAERYQHQSISTFA